jgi:hypothetical protein
MDNIILKGDELIKKLKALKKLEIDNINWRIYYLDEQTNEKWVEEYPYSELQGGGPTFKRWFGITRL